jgi:metallothionein
MKTSKCACQRRARIALDFLRANTRPLAGTIAHYFVGPAEVKSASYLSSLPANTREAGKEIHMSDQKKCANPACSCVPANKEKFCSAHCEGLKGSTEVMCDCGHPGCIATA